MTFNKCWYVIHDAWGVCLYLDIDTPTDSMNYSLDITGASEDYVASLVEQLNLNVNNLIYQLERIKRGN